MPMPRLLAHHRMAIHSLTATALLPSAELQYKAVSLCYVIISASYLMVTIAGYWVRAQHAQHVQHAQHASIPAWAAPGPSASPSPSPPSPPPRRRLATLPIWCSFQSCFASGSRP